jgi:hypothetical protein
MLKLASTRERVLNSPKFSLNLYLGYGHIYRVRDEHPYCKGFVFFCMGAPLESDLDSGSSSLQSWDSSLINLQARSLAANPRYIFNPKFLGLSSLPRNSGYDSFLNWD